ncbi:prepilin-type N-terminal cleavage/methylation domain-containing protein [Myxococcus sp. CA051A]|uniref:type IV pilus modification PilV family protein n=1 Tax=unclassified Myxococcus TaxID=2648731 RepID=UPI00157A415F|nr:MULTISPECIES: prepilin-type N-terminal cleavage/methylation domain-containing protein [unclassified Myxococcus]NTX10111.1 prepilin-type N-terminal cleavage/methylation domain-containing protein [Myxococcus sp. CA056]NTX39932.1 prepilin-type N-terminal cleavage/methylation domain-containing protein [Myxococcus sp. CA033]NTX64575.1 prepilin-type N-terminal cleavage/methylation domain-containing protein [Myxococcus sp. CA051A]
MKSPRFHTSRGVTLLEVLATMAVMLVGVAAVMTLVTQISASNRRTLTATQAQLLAERRLETITAMGCSPAPNPCSNLGFLDNTRERVWQTAAGDLLPAKPTNGAVAREYEVAVDLDSNALGGSIENGAAGFPPVNRDLGGVANSPGNVVNVRVSVSWIEPARTGRQVVVLQTRVAP